MPARLHSSAAAAQWLAARVRGQLHTDSRAVRPGDGFMAWPGRRVDGRSYVAGALAAGAAACLVEDEDQEAFDWHGAEVATLPGLQAAAGAIAADYYGHPSRELDVVAVTGTNGKTSSAWWTAQALTRLGRRCGVIGTLGIGEPPQLEPGVLTTPDAPALQGALRRLADAGCSACALEASSVGIVQGRLAATYIDVAVYTNFTRDHLDFHGSMAAYWQAKRALFDWPGLRAAVINIDDGPGAALAAELAASKLELWTVSLARPARLQVQGLHYVDGGLAFELHEGLDRVDVRSTLVGDYNAANLVGVLAALRALGIALADAVAAVDALTPVPGRMERVAGGELEVLVDYAHTPDALEKVLQALRPLAAARRGRLWCVFGCGGNRDASKRPLMGAIAERGADRVVLTSDNPRDEAPAAILAQILAGVERPQGVEVHEDRAAAIAHAVGRAEAGDVVLLAGKGHETTQEIAGVKRPFSDLEQARTALRVREAARR